MYAPLRLFLGPMLVMHNEMRGSLVQKENVLMTMIATWILPAVIFELAVGRGPDDDEEEWRWALRKILLYPLATLPAIRDMYQPIESWLTDKPEFSRMNPLAELVNAGFKAFKKIESDSADEGDKVKAAIQVGGIFGLPSNAVGTAANYVVDLYTGDADFTSPLDLRFLFITRPADRN